ncbi:MAG TPA: branched-chain amino acid ABC transporter permease [Burkholderiales bacterium]|nr:branched-chain amino acid ABC transporter permease [Burkholderiales bacterium]
MDRLLTSIRPRTAQALQGGATRGMRGVAIGLALLIAWALVPLVASRSIVDLLVFAALYTIAGLGVSFLLGQCGIVSIAQSVFYGIGAYSTAYLTTHWGWPALACMAVGIGISTTIAFAVGWPILRLSGYFLALATLALAIIGHVLFTEWDWLTGGTLGIGGIPALRIGEYQFNTPQRFYYLVWPIALLLLFAHRNLLHLRTGFAMRAMRDAPAAAAVLGIDVHRLKVQVFVLSAALGAIAGSLLAHYVTFISVDSFGIDRAINFLLLAVLGGARTIIGPVLGALFITIVPHALSGFGDIHAVLFAAFLIATVIFLPAGFGGSLHRLVESLKPSERVDDK